MRFQRLFDLIPDTYLTQTALSVHDIKKDRPGTLSLTDRVDKRFLVIEVKEEIDKER